MGRGVALQAKQRYKHIATILASHITLYGNHVSLIIESEVYKNIISFPVKHHWYEKANLDLIRISAIELLVLIKPLEIYKNFRHSPLQLKLLIIVFSFLEVLKALFLKLLMA